MSFSNIGDSPVCFLQGLNHFKHLRIFWAQQPSVGSLRESDIFCTCVSKMSQSQAECPALQGVSGEVPLDWLLDWVGALEELLAGLLAIGSLGGVQVLVQQLPEVIGHVQDLKVPCHPEKVECEWMWPKIAPVLFSLTGSLTSACRTCCRSTRAPSSPRRSASSGTPGRCSQTSRTPMEICFYWVVVASKSI